jgi:hypothetical protein
LDSTKPAGENSEDSDARVVAGLSAGTAADVPPHFHFNRNFFALGTVRLYIHFAEKIKRQ